MVANVMIYPKVKRDDDGKPAEKVLEMVDFKEILWAKKNEAAPKIIPNKSPVKSSAQKVIGRFFKV